MMPASFFRQKGYSLIGTGLLHKFHAMLKRHDRIFVAMPSEDWTVADPIKLQGNIIRFKRLNRFLRFRFTDLFFIPLIELIDQMLGKDRHFWRSHQHDGSFYPIVPL